MNFNKLRNFMSIPIKSLKDEVDFQQKKAEAELKMYEMKQKRIDEEAERTVYESQKYMAAAANSAQKPTYLSNADWEKVMAMKDAEDALRQEINLPKPVDPMDIPPKKIVGVPFYLAQHKHRAFVEQLCCEIERFRFTEDGQALMADGAVFSAVPACVVSPSVFRYMAMACNPHFKGEGRLAYSSLTVSMDAPAHVRFDHSNISSLNSHLFGIANNSLDAMAYIDSDMVSAEQMKIVSAQSTINFGIDPSLEDWQARVCFDNGSNKNLTVGMSDNRFYE